MNHKLGNKMAMHAVEGRAANIILNKFVIFLCNCCDKMLQNIAVIFNDYTFTNVVGQLPPPHTPPPNITIIYSPSFEELIVEDKCVSIHHRNIQKVAIEMFNVKNDLCPKFISSLFCRTNTQTRYNAAFHRPSVNSVYNGELSFRNFGPIVWDNMLPPKLKEITTLEKFKLEIKGWAPQDCMQALQGLYSKPRICNTLRIAHQLLIQ